MSIFDQFSKALGTQGNDANTLIRLSLGLGFPTTINSKSTGYVTLQPTAAVNSNQQLSNINSAVFPTSKPINPTAPLSAGQQPAPSSTTGWPVVYSQLNNGQTVSAFVMPGEIAAGQLGALSPDNPEILADPGKAMTQDEYANIMAGKPEENTSAVAKVPETPTAKSYSTPKAPDMANYARIDGKRRRSAQTRFATFMGTTLG